MKNLAFVIAACALSPLASATEVVVKYSDEFAEELSEELGEKEGEYLSREIVDDVTRSLTRMGIAIDRVEVTIIEAKPNRPTSAQLNRRRVGRRRIGQQRSGSYGIGGMELEGVAFNTQGTRIGTFHYRWFETDIENVVGFNTWTDAHRASDRFARRLAKSLR